MKDNKSKEEFYPGRTLYKNENQSDVVISNEAIAAVVEESAREIDGFVRFADNLTDVISKMLKGENRDGIFVYNRLHPSGTNIVEIDISVVLEYGQNISQVCSMIQKNIALNVEKYVDISVSKVNIYVASIESVSGNKKKKVRE